MTGLGRTRGTCVLSCCGVLLAMLRLLPCFDLAWRMSWCVCEIVCSVGSSYTHTCDLCCGVRCVRVLVERRARVWRLCRVFDRRARMCEYVMDLLAVLGSHTNTFCRCYDLRAINCPWPYASLKLCGLLRIKLLDTTTTTIKKKRGALL